MNYEDFAAELPLQRTLAFFSAEENEETMRALDINQDVRQLGRGAFRADLMVRSTPHGELYCDRFSTSFSIRLEPPVDHVGFLIPASASGHLLCCGQPTTSEMLLVVPPGTDLDIVGQDLSGSDCFAIREQRFMELSEALNPTPRSVSVQGLRSVSGDPSQLRALRNALVALAVAEQHDPHDDDVSDLLDRFVVWMGESSKHWRPERFPLNGVKQRVARRAQAYFLDHYPQPIRMEDVCRELGVGLRTLQRCFAEYFQMSPSVYLKKLRYNQAHRALRLARPETHSVTETALDNGFYHFGRFSVEYREMFGESPRDTLGRVH